VADLTSESRKRLNGAFARTPRNGSAEFNPFSLCWLPCGDGLDKRFKRHEIAARDELDGSLVF
jgi:hypothetical protein